MPTPMPFEAPVTTATLPLSAALISNSLKVDFWNERFKIYVGVTWWSSRDTLRIMAAPTNKNPKQPGSTAKTSEACRAAHEGVLGRPRGFDTGAALDAA